MKTNLAKHGGFALLFGIAWASMLSFSCGGGGGASMSSVESVSKYLMKDKVNQSEASGFVAYFDFSDGMQLAYADEDTKKVVQGIVQKVTSVSDEFTMFSLADNEISPLEGKTTNLFNTIMDNNSYKKQNAPIEKTLEKIVGEGKSALLITDFEEYTGVMEKSAFATPYFKKWLEAGKDITFFVTDYLENGKDKHLYYIVFDNPLHKLVKLIEDGMQGKPQNYKKFLLSTTSYVVVTDYPAEIKGGSYRDSKGNDNVTAVIEDGDGESFAKLDSLNAEYYPLGVNWQDIVVNAKSLMEEGVPAEDKFSHLFSNLYLDISKLDSYTIKSLDLKVYNIEKDLASYTMNQEALMSKGTENEANYFDENGKLMADFEYKASQPTEIKDMLTFDKDLFAQSESDGKVKLAVNLDPKFDGTIVGAEPADMLRADIYITECEPNYDKLPELFQWTGNDNLYESVKNTLQDLRPNGKVIYSFIIRGAK